MTDPARWSTPSDVEAAVRRRWRDGSLLRAFGCSEAFPTIDVPLRGPAAGDLGNHFDAAREWAATVRRAARDGRHFEIVFTMVGGRVAGRTELPGRAVVSSYEQAWRMLGVGKEAAQYPHLLEEAAATPHMHEWTLTHPLRALPLADEWDRLIAAYRWLDANRDSGHYIRQIDAPGVDTKFVERHRGVLASLLNVSATAGGFIRGLGLTAKPVLLRARFDSSALGLPASLSEAAFHVVELADVEASPRIALIVENEVSYLSVPIPQGGVVLWGKGYDADRAASLSWLSHCPVAYWGDIDTHGFAILSRLRSHLPHTASILMDRETLLAHEERWVREDTPTSAALTQLDPRESALYSELVTDRFGPSVRLEQERIDWAWVRDRLPE